MPGNEMYGLYFCPICVSICMWKKIILVKWQGNLMHGGDDDDSYDSDDMLVVMVMLTIMVSWW